TTFMHIVGVVEIAAGLIVLSRWTRLGSYVVTLWLVAIALNLLVMGKFLDVAVRDLGLAVAAFTLSQLTAVREEASMASRTSSSRSQCARSSAFSALAAEAAAFAVTSFQWPNPCRVLRDRAGLLNSCENETLTRTAALP
ncbi:MAG TPA: hypothetical protein VGU90_02020, partial [Terriglobales bacterium]|nr:hypothetical protein [Terriglobales bacterium]